MPGSPGLSRMSVFISRSTPIVAFVVFVMGLAVYSTYRFEDVRRFRQTTALVSDASPDLKVAWLMSFPNSGTTFTSQVVQVGSGLSTATNYGHEYSDEKGNPLRVTRSTPVYESGFRGPFRASDLPLPKRFVLTKTHCGGFGFSDCRPRDYAFDPEGFLNECVRGAHFTPDPQARTRIHSNMSPAIREWVQYDPALVGKAVHIVRNPYDNAVARFHHEYRLHAAGETVDLPDWFGAQYAYNSEGFRSWCRDTDTRFRQEREQYLRPTAIKYVDRVPCHAEFYKYVQWHNLAFAVTAYLGVPPAFVLHYEDFHTDFHSTKVRLFRYLELEQVAQVPTFKYRGYEEEYYTPEERAHIHEYVRELASPETWANVKQYFPAPTTETGEVEQGP